MVGSLTINLDNPFSQSRSKYRLNRPGAIQFSRECVAMDNASGTCESCGDRTAQAYVQYRSYVIYCANCGARGAATSFMALRTISGEFRAHLDAGVGRLPQYEDLVAEGPMDEIYEEVSSAAAKGNRVILVPFTDE
jgi:hypothetical protein